jgi:hypothetical protein
MSDFNVPAAWYPDPGGSEAKRWWDGTAWTEHLRVPEPPPPSTRNEAWNDVWNDTRGEFSLPHAAQSTEQQPAVQPFAFTPFPDATAALPQADGYVPMARRQFRAERRDPTLVYTSPAWWLAVSPAWILGLQFVPLVASGSRVLVTAILMAAALLMTAALTMLDRKLLLTDGYRSAASAWWWWLSPLVYLSVRATHTYREMRAGWAPAIVFALLVAADVAAQLTIARDVLYQGL